MAVLGEPVSGATQVQQMLDSITHEPTNQAAVDVMFHTPDTEGELSMALSLTTKKMNFWGQQLGAMGEGGISETRKIQKLQCKVKALKKAKKGNDDTTTTVKAGSSGGSNNGKNYIPPVILDAICKEAGKDSRKIIGWLMKGCAAAMHSIKAAKGKGNGSEDEQGSDNSNDSRDAVEAKSASLSMGRKSTKHHQDNPNPKKHHKINAICMVSLQVKAAHQIDHPTEYTNLCQVEVDLHADTCCAGATFHLIANTGKTANVEGFHGDLGKLEGIPINTCYTVIDQSCRK